MIPRVDQWSEIAGAGSGDLEVTSYAVVLAAMARSGRTVSLRLTRKPVTKQVILVEGRPIACSSNLAHETFGRFLLGEGALAAEDHPQALAESLRREIPLGEVLIEKGLLSPHEVYRYLQKNLARKLLDAFTWDRGNYEVIEDERPPDSTVKLNAAQLILTGVLKLTPQAEVEAGVARLRGEKLAREPRPTFEEGQLRLGGGSERVVQALGVEALAFEDLAEAVSLPAEELDRVVYALALVGLVVPATEVASQPAEPSRRPAAGLEAGPAAPKPEGPERPERTERDPELDQALLLRQTKIVEAYLSFRRKDAFEFLDLEETAGEQEIDRAFLEAAETYAPWSLEAKGATDFGEQGELLFLRAARAYAELRNSESRGALIHRRKVLRDQEADRKKAKFAIETDLLDPEEQFKKGLALAQRGDLGKALGLLEFAVDCDPQSALYRAELAYQRDRFEAHRYRKQSIADLKEAARIDPRCGEAHYYLGLILASENDLAGAEAALRRSIKLMAPDRRPIDALRRLSTGKKR